MILEKNNSNIDRTYFLLIFNSNFIKIIFYVMQERSFGCNTKKIADHNMHKKA